MSTKRKVSRKKPVEIDLFGEPVRPPPPDREIVDRPDGRSYAIAVRQPGRTSRLYVGVYNTRGEAATALRDGVGLLPGEDRVEVAISIFRSRARHRH